MLRAEAGKFPFPISLDLMFSEQIELRGHIIDSLTLPKVLDEILTNGGSFSINEIKIGKKRHDASYARIEVSGPSPEVVDARETGVMAFLSNLDLVDAERDQDWKETP